jgi:hypothetical protein
VRTTVKDAIDAATTAARAGAPSDSGLVDPFNTALSRPGLLDAFNAVAAPLVRGVNELIRFASGNGWASTRNELSAATALCPCRRSAMAAPNGP